jgi:cyclopropane-fatty-acyl-phospholipid synthase
MGPVQSAVSRWLYASGGFMHQYVFPDGELVPIGPTLEAAENAGFEVRDVESMREHYALTLRHWIRRLEEHRQEASDLVGVATYRIWRLYMAGCAHTFETARNNLYQSLLVKSDAEGRSHMPPTRRYMYAA